MENLKAHYQQKNVVYDYCRRRFESPFGKYFHQRQIRFIQKWMNSHNPKLVLDLAPGPARIASSLVGNFNGVLVDFSHPMLVEARKQLREISSERKWEYIRGDAFQLPLRASFDLVTCFRFLRHLRWRERVCVYSEIARVLRKGGVLIFDAVHFDGAFEFRRQDPNLDPSIYDKLYRWEELQNEIEESGFEILERGGILHNPFIFRKVDKFCRRFRQTWMEIPILHWLDWHKKGYPLEWVIVCRKK